MFWYFVGVAGMVVAGCCQCVGVSVTLLVLLYNRHVGMVALMLLVCYNRIVVLFVLIPMSVVFVWSLLCSCLRV